MLTMPLHPNLQNMPIRQRRAEILVACRAALGLDHAGYEEHSDAVHYINSRYDASDALTDQLICRLLELSAANGYAVEHLRPENGLGAPLNRFGETIA